ncbi:hypothetical protein BDW62DRAFT_188098 [Aspergillus aurantiobrunneus]
MPWAPRLPRRSEAERYCARAAGGCLPEGVEGPVGFNRILHPRSTGLDGGISVPLVASGIVILRPFPCPRRCRRW